MTERTKAGDKYAILMESLPTQLSYTVFQYALLLEFKTGQLLEGCAKLSQKMAGKIKRKRYIFLYRKGQ